MKTRMALCLSSAVLGVLHLVRLVAVIGPTVLIASIADSDGSISLNEVSSALSVYSFESSKYLDVSEGYFFSLIIYYAISSFLILMTSIAVFFNLRKSQLVLIALVVIEIIVAIAIKVSAGYTSDLLYILAHVVMSAVLLFTLYSSNTKRFT